MNTWSEKVAELRSLGWTLTGLAKAIGLSPQAVCDLAEGRSAEPRGMSAVRLYQLHQRRTLPPRGSQKRAA